MRILKFGGTSLAAPETIRRVVEIVRDSAADSRVAVVVSAFGGVTDRLVEAARLAESNESGWRQILAALETRHLQAIGELAAQDQRQALEERIRATHRELDELLRGVSMVREASERSLARILSTGELLSAAIVAAAFRSAGIPATDVDARRLIVTTEGFGTQQVEETPTHRAIRDHFASAGDLQVVTGFIAATASGETTTLGRGGSDYTASILGAALQADAVELWTDVDGVLSADPRKVPGAELCERLSYEELLELSHFGAKVVHPPSVHPTRKLGIPLTIRNTLRPESRGTRVADENEASSPSHRIVRGLASIPRVALARLEGDGMIGIPGIAARLFGALAKRHVNVIMISQASSEHSICFAVEPEAVEATALAVAEEFEAELRTEQIDELVLEEDLAIVAAVGAGMCETHGVAGRVFGVLGQAGVNVRAIAQGSSELNISLVVDADDEVKALNAIHGAFFPGSVRTPPSGASSKPKIFLAGAGQVGRALLGQLAELANGGGPALEIGGLSRSRGALLWPQGIAPSEAAAQLDSAQTLCAPDELARAAAGGEGPRVFVDCTASSETADLYGDLLRSGVPVVAANKLRFAGPLEGWRELAGSPVYFETTVGAALPVISSLRALLRTGDRPGRIEAVLSGTLAHVLDEVSNGRKFSEAVVDARRRGFTEPDPRQDLGGLDVARKILVLARLAGRDLELDEVTLEPLLPDDSWLEGGVDDFLARLPELDPPIGRRAQSANQAGRRLVYLAELDDDGARVGLCEMSDDHPVASGRGTDNVVVMTTARYDERPLVVRGPGAGPDLTASGVLADILRALAENEVS